MVKDGSRVLLLSTRRRIIVCMFGCDPKSPDISGWLESIPGELDTIRVSVMTLNGHIYNSPALALTKDAATTLGNVEASL